MTSITDSTILNSFVSVYDTVPDKWEEAKPFFVEQLKALANTVNVRVIGYYIDVQIPAGKQFIPSSIVPPGNNPGLFREVFRIVVNLGSLVMGANIIPVTNVIFDTNFTLVDTWVAGTNTINAPFNAQVITDANVNLVSNGALPPMITGTVTSPQAFNKAFLFIEYLLQP